MNYEEIAGILRSEGCSIAEIDKAIDFLIEHEQECTP